MSSRDTARSGSHAGEYDACLRLHELCEAAGASSEQVTALVQRGVLKPSGKSPRDWSFPHEAVFRLRTAMRLSGGESNPADRKSVV